MKKVKLLIIAFAILLLGVEHAASQQTININQTETVMRLRSQASREAMVNEFFGKSVQSRTFEYNTQLKTLTENNKGNILLLDFFNDKQYKAVIQSVTRSYDGVLGITAKVDDSYGYCYISISKSGILINAEIPEKNEMFSISEGKTGAYLSQYSLSSVMEKALPCEEMVPPEIDPSVNLRATQDGETLPGALSACGSADLDSPVTIDVLFVYTPAAETYAATHYTSIDNVIDLAVQKANTVMANSLTNITFNMVYKYKTNYTETDSDTDLDRLTNPNDGYMDEVHALRKQYNADLVQLIPSVTYTGGVGWLLPYEQGFPAYGFALSRVEQASWTATVVHEIGHNMGCSHHALQGGTGLYSYSYGYRGNFSDGTTNSKGTTKFATVMTYEDLHDGQGEFPRIDYFSDPNITVGGVPIGTSEANNALTLRRTKRLTSLYSDLINLSLSSLTVSAGTLTPAFNPDITEYTVTVPNTVTTIDITGTPNYSCATVTGNVTGKTLNYGANTVTIIVNAHNNTAQKVYTVTVNRLTTTCGTYESRPNFAGNVSATASSSSLNLNLGAAVPVSLFSSMTIGTTQKQESVYVYESSEFNSCRLLGNFNVFSGPVKKFRVTESGDYTFERTNGDYAVMTFFNSETASCESFLESNTAWTGGDASSIYYPSDEITIALNVNTDYYLRTFKYNTATTWEISITGPGNTYSESTIPSGMAYTYIAVSQADSKIKAQSATADFRTIAPGIYTIYGIPYSTSSDPTTFTGKTLAEIQASDCVTPSMTSITMTVDANDYRWTPEDTGSTSWTLASNWTPSGVPSALSRVTIPASESYPVLTAAASADEITFEAGAELGRQDLLTYNKARIALDFGASGLARNKWHLLSMPLDKVVTGDFSFGGYPYTFLRKFVITSPESGQSYHQAGWTPFHTNVESLAIGEGFALWVNAGTGNEIGKKDTGSGTDSQISNSERNYGLGQTNGIIILPYLDNQVANDAHRIHKYENGKSLFYTMNVSLPNHDLTNYLEVERGDNAYRLAQIPANGTWTYPVAFGEDNSRFFALAGNPFISTIDFDEFQLDNNDIKSSYQIWTGSGFAAYDKDGQSGIVEDGVTLTKFIAPMQAFFVEKSSGTDGSAILNFNITKISASNHPATLRSSLPVDPPATAGKLEITASNGGYSVLTYIAKREYGSAQLSDADSRKIVPGMSDVPEIYTIKESGSDKTAVGSNIVNTDDIFIPLGLATAYTGNIRLQFKGMDNYGSRIAFIDLIDGKEIDLTGMTKYEYSFDYTPKTANGDVEAEENRFVIRISKIPTGIEAINEPVQVYGSNNTIFAVSSPANPIRQLDIYNIQGQLLYSKKNMDSSLYSIDINNSVSNIYIVRLVTGHGVKSVKIFMNK